MDFEGVEMTLDIDGVIYLIEAVSLKDLLNCSYFKYKKVMVEYNNFVKEFLTNLDTLSIPECVESIGFDYFSPNHSICANTNDFFEQFLQSVIDKAEEGRPGISKVPKLSYF